MTQPVEYISFINGTDVWRYTNSNTIEQIGARSFNPLSYRRTEPVYSKDTADGQVEITVPASIAFVLLYGPNPSSFTSTVVIEKTDRETPGSERVYWSGAVVSVQKNGKFATVLAAPLSALPTQVPRYTYSGLCNWVLFQDRCGLERLDYRHEGTVLSVEAPTIFTVDGLTAQATALAAAAGGNLTQTEIDTYWLGGYVENTLGEKRPIYEADVGGFSDRIRILRPFTNLLQSSDGVTVYAGCARTRTICKNKFANNLNHGGFPDIPEGINPFRSELPPGGSNSEKKRFWGTD